MPIGTSGIVTARDQFATDFERASLLARIERFATSQESGEQLCKMFGIEENYAWSADDAKRALAKLKNKRQFLREVMVRPYDQRPIFFEPNVVWRLRNDVMQHLQLPTNLSILTTRLTKDQWDIGASRVPITHKAISGYDIGYQFPLWLHSGQPHKADLHDDDLISQLPGSTANLNPAFVTALREVMGLGEASWRPEKPAAPLNAEKVFHYIYAVLHSPEYRQRYAGFLRNDFARIPVPGSRALFDALSTLGAQLVQRHLLEHPTAAAITATTAPKGLSTPAFFGDDRKLLKVAEKGRELANMEATAAGPAGKVCINATSGFSGVRQAVWQHTIGGYQVLHKWLDDRRKAERSLSDDEIAHWRRIYAALEATQSLMAQVDQAIAANGGWPGAFSQDHPPPDPATLAAQPAAKKPRAKRASAGQTSLFGDADEAEEAKHRPKARATPARATRSAGGATQPELDDTASMAALREVLRLADEPLVRKTLIQRAAHALGYRRTGPRIAAALDDTVRRAVRRRIAASERGTFHLLTRKIGDYERGFLKTQLLACLGREWVERQDVARRLARWLGFARTGATIEATVKSLVTSLLRAGALQRRGTEVHRA